MTKREGAQIAINAIDACPPGDVAKSPGECQLCPSPSSSLQLRPVEIQRGYCCFTLQSSAYFTLPSQSTSCSLLSTLSSSSAAILVLFVCVPSEQLALPANSEITVMLHHAKLPSRRCDGHYKLSGMLRR